MGNMKYFLQAKLFNFFVYAKYIQLKWESNLSPVQMEALQRRKIKSLVRAAMKHELYREKFKAAGLDPKKVCTQQDLEKLAPLTKDEYRNMIDTAMTQNSEQYYRFCHRGRTSGSTGVPLHTCLTPIEHATVVAQLLYILNRNGYRVFLDASMDMRSPSQAGSSATSIFQKFGLLRKYYVSTLDDPENIVREINRLKPDEFKAGKSLLHALLQYADEHNLEIHPIKYVVSSAEPMDDATRELVNKFFGPNALIDIYATIETGLMCYTMGGNPYKFHQNPAHYLYTILDKNGQPADSGELFVTNLYLKLFPMLNYKQGDSVNSFIDQEDGKQYLTAVTGRNNDFLLTSKGERISILHIFPVIAPAYKQLEQYRFVQEEYDKVTLVLAMRKNSDETQEQVEQKILQAADHYLSGKLQLSFEWVEKIPIDPNDKIRVLISKVKERV